MMVLLGKKLGNINRKYDSLSCLSYSVLGQSQAEFYNKIFYNVTIWQIVTQIEDYIVE